jgi:hypothetical protein
MAFGYPQQAPSGQRRAMALELLTRRIQNCFTSTDIRWDP